MKKTLTTLTLIVLTLTAWAGLVQHETATTTVTEASDPVWFCLINSGFNTSHSADSLTVTNMQLQACELTAH